MEGQSGDKKKGTRERGGRGRRGESTLPACGEGETAERVAEREIMK